MRGKAVRGGLATVAAQVLKFLIKGSALVVLARLLKPTDFGLVAMVAAFTGFVTLFKDLGLSMATVQRDQITQEQVSTLFWINVGLSVVLMGIAAALAPAVAWFYGEPSLTLIMLAVAIVYNYPFAWRRYPQAWARRQSHPDEKAMIPHSRLVYALSQIDTFVDVTDEDLQRIYELAMQGEVPEPQVAAAAAAQSSRA